MAPQPSYVQRQPIYLYVPARGRDRDHDGIRNSRDRGRDGDGIRNSRDRQPTTRTGIEYCVQSENLPATD